MIDVKAWEYEFSLRTSARPTALSSTWQQVNEFQIFSDELVKLFWKSEVPGSRAPECLIAGAIQSVENMGMDVSTAEKLFKKGLQLLEENKFDQLKSITSLILKELREAPKLANHPYHSFKRPLEWEEISKGFPKENFKLESIKEKILGGWLGQIAGASMGTKLEGYFGEVLEETYGEQLGYYLQEPDTYNDDITYELAVLKTIEETGRLDAIELAKKWIELIPFGWSAEYVALENLKSGIFPPMSGWFNNPFQEWIGAQMRCMVHGLLNPARPFDACYSAYLDSIISHSGNGVYGGIHCAALTSLSFVYNDTRKLLIESMKFIPKGTELEYIASKVLSWCAVSTDWREVREKVQEQFKQYNWIHLYPNFCCVITALWFGNGNFDESMRVISAMGYDVDCNAGEVGTVLGIINGANNMPKKWVEPLRDELRTYVRGFEKVNITKLAEMNYSIILKNLN